MYFRSAQQRPALLTVRAGVRRCLLATVASTVVLLTGCASSAHVETHPVVASRGADPATDLRIAESALASGDTDLAATLFEKALKADPQALAAQLGLADTVYQTGDVARAGALYARVAATAPQEPRAQLGLARVALRTRRLDEAITRYRALAAAHAGNAVAAEGLGTALDLSGRHDEAQSVYRAALRLHPEAQGLKTDLGLSLILANRPHEGANVLLDIAALPDAPREARENLALAYGLLGNGEAAKRILSTAMPAASVEDNLAFYRALRERMAADTAAAPVSGPAGDGAAKVAAVPTPSVSSAGAQQ
jgi:Flp pilus assembly protein TadD